MFNIGDIHAKNTILSRAYVNGKVEYFVKCDCGDFRWVRSDILKKNKWGCRKCANKFSRKKLGESYVIGAAWHSLNGNAKSRNLFVEITKTDFINIAKQNCFYCGEEPKKTSHANLPEWSTPAKLNGIDRIDNSLGYTIKNSVACCYICNRGKMDMSLQDFKDWIKKLSKRDWLND
jgi:hypothetical protein